MKSIHNTFLNYLLVMIAIVSCKQSANTFDADNSSNLASLDFSDAPLPWIKTQVVENASETHKSLVDRYAAPGSDLDQIQKELFSGEIRTFSGKNTVDDSATFKPKQHIVIQVRLWSNQTLSDQGAAPNLISLPVYSDILKAGLNPVEFELFPVGKNGLPDLSSGPASKFKTKVSDSGSTNSEDTEINVEIRHGSYSRYINSSLGNKLVKVGVNLRLSTSLEDDSLPEVSNGKIVAPNKTLGDAKIDCNIAAGECTLEICNTVHSCTAKKHSKKSFKVVKLQMDYSKRPYICWYKIEVTLVANSGHQVPSVYSDIFAPGTKNNYFWISAAGPKQTGGTQTGKNKPETNSFLSDYTQLNDIEKSHCHPEEFTQSE